jgi:hypothetical protein
MSDMMGRLRVAARYYDESYPPDLYDPTELQPSIASLAPSSIVIATPTTVTVTGTNFDASRSVVWVDGVAQATTYISATSVSYQAEGDQVGSQTVVVHNGSRISNPVELTVTATAGELETATTPPPVDPPPPVEPPPPDPPPVEEPPPA